MHNLKTVFSACFMVAGLLLTEYGHASVLTIDDFSQAQTVFDSGMTGGATSDTIDNMSGNGLSNVSRTLIAEATAGNFLSYERIRIDNYSLKISNSVSSAGTSAILWTFDPANFTSYGNGLRLEVLKTETDPNFNVSVEMVVNGVSHSGVKTFSTTGDVLFGFNDFSDVSALTNANSLRLNFFNGSLSWDGEFRLSTLNLQQGNLTAVPVPPTFVLMGSVLLCFMGISRKTV